MVINHWFSKLFIFTALALFCPLLAQRAIGEDARFPSTSEINAAVIEGLSEALKETANDDPLLEDLSQEQQAPTSQPSISKKVIITYKVKVGVWPVIIERTVIVEIYVEDGKIYIKTKIGDEPPTTEELTPGAPPQGPTAEEIKKLRKALEDLKKDRSINGGDIEAVTGDGAKDKIKEDIRRRLRDFVNGQPVMNTASSAHGLQATESFASSASR